MQFRDTLNRLEQISNNLKSQGVTVDPLNQAIADLKTHQGNSEAIEAHIDAIRQEVIGPIQNEFQKANKISTFGFWIGLVGFVVSILTIVLQYFVPPTQIINSNQAIETNLQKAPSLPSVSDNGEVLRRLDLIEQQLLFPKGVIGKDGSLFVRYTERQKIASVGTVSYFLEVYSFRRKTDDGTILAGIQIFRGDQQIGIDSLVKATSRSDGKVGLRDEYFSEAIPVRPGDIISLGPVKVEILRIFWKEPAGRLIGDDKSGVQFRIRTNK